MSGSPLGGFFAASPPRVLAHRGLHTEAPENTMLAFAAAVAIGVTHIETDVHVSADGVAVIAHDPDLSRVAGRNVRVDQLTAAELARVPLGEGQGFPTLAEALDAFPETNFNIDIKTLGAAGPAAAAIRETNAVQRALIASFRGANRLAAANELPGVLTSLSTQSSAAAVAAARAGTMPLLRRLVRGTDAVQLPYRWRGFDLLSEGLVRNLHAAGVEVHAWVVNDVETMKTLLERGVDGLVSDRADLALEVVAAHEG